MIGMPRKSLTGGGQSPYQYFRVDEEVKRILENVPNKSQFIREAIKTQNKKNLSVSLQYLDTKILTKLIPVYFRNNLDVFGLEPEELDRIKELFKENIPKFNFGSLGNIIVQERSDYLIELGSDMIETVKSFKTQKNGDSRSAKKKIRELKNLQNSILEIADSIKIAGETSLND